MSSMRSSRLSDKHSAPNLEAPEPVEGIIPSSFITVKYGDNQESVFNTWCPGNALLYCIRRRCGCDEDALVDLCDLEGNIRNLPGHPYEYANTFLDGRRTYVLVKVEKSSDSEPSRYTSLLNDIDEVLPELTVKLNSLSRASNSRREKEQKSARWAAMRAATKFTRATKSRDGRRKESGQTTASRDSVR